jgi:uncharacterized membrane protein
MKNPLLVFLDFFSRPDVVLFLRVIWDIGLGLAFVLGIALSFFSDAKGPLFGVISILIGVWTLVAGLRALKLEKEHGKRDA